jgi:hypothetical protein
VGALAPTWRPHQHIKDSRGFLCFSLRLFAILKDVNDDGVLVNVVRIFQLPKETSSPVFRAKEGNSLTTDKESVIVACVCDSVLHFLSPLLVVAESVFDFVTE